ncbi:hypothetical protein GMA19_02399 [Paenibacillus polymyxa E681]|nr:hypothetical protein PPE_05810 [Paenibacillus polymyxa E681]QNV57229.1 hypothetical protein GE561_02399 [Paenibacillus polymyxa E681]QNV62066.1 hypothetical protein GMA19_02399 [Paenibacillus polymyxa E681]
MNLEKDRISTAQMILLGLFSLSGICKRLLLKVKQQLTYAHNHLLSLGRFESQL